jgi:hypothetical protein
MSASLFGFGIFFPLREILSHGLALSIAATLTIVTAGVLSLYSFFLRSRSARAFVGLSLLFFAIWFGVQNDVFAVSVLWAGVLFGAVDSLGKIKTKRDASTDPAEQDVRERRLSL